MNASTISGKATEDPILSAIDMFKLLLQCIDKEDVSKSEIGKKFRSRCRELPGLIEDVGFTPALSFCYGKAGNEIYQKVKDILMNKGKLSEGKETEKGYGIYLYFVLKRLNELGLIEEDHLSKPVDALGSIRAGKERIASRIIRPFVVQLKKLSEAIFEVE
nr:type III-B CRISPR module-associated protein Cmr5 [Candidatus Freyarchaeota archaeon]